MSGDQGVEMLYDFVAKQNHLATNGRTPTMNQKMPFLPGLSPVEGKALTATFDGGRMSSDGGVIVLREIAVRLSLAFSVQMVRLPLLCALSLSDPSSIEADCSFAPSRSR